MPLFVMVVISWGWVGGEGVEGEGWIEGVEGEGWIEGVD